MLFYSIDMQMSFLEYLTEDNLIEFVIKERVKCTQKQNLSKDRVQHIEQAQTPSAAVQVMTPPRNSWRRLRRSSRHKIERVEIKNKLSLRNTIYYDLKLYRNNMVIAPPYLQELMAFISRVQEMASDVSNWDFSSCIKVLAKFKEDDADGNAIYRPLTIYNSLEIKALISLASTYLTTAVDDYLHEEILSYRPLRLYHGKENYHTGGYDAIAGLRRFIEDHPGQKIYVAECDIQKFYDAINHEVVLDSFRRIAEQASIPAYHEVERILKLYLDSYSFHSNIMALNDSQEYWKEYERQHKGKIKGKCLFKWVSDDDFLRCYKDPAKLKFYKDKIGVPQGGALSCIISNVVLNDVDRRSVLVKEEDPDRFFVRFGDDILLAHTDLQECTRLIDAYTRELERHLLPSHPFKPMDECKNGEKTTKEFWKRKSKAPFLWGPGEGNAFEWIGFVGYEVRYTGESRLRLSTLDKQFGSINKRYHSCILKDKPNNTRGYLSSNIRKVAGMNTSLSKFEQLDMNPYSIQQVKSLDRYRLTKIERLDAMLSARFAQEYTDTTANLVNRFVKHRDEPTSYYRRLMEIDSNLND